MQTSQSAVANAPPKLEQALTGEVRCIDINEIDLYDKNPRRSKNPAYERIKASILANGLDQPLIVTQRPADEQFVVHAGGNTRLQILKELHAVSSDPSFGLLNCIYVPWNSESTVLLAHLRENDLRGDLTFIDKAVAICALEDLLTEETASDRLSIRDLQRVLRERGYSISLGLISYMRYAVNVLLPVMPVALAEGLGRRQVQRIRQLQRLATGIWVSREIGSENEFDGIFSELCRRHDMPDWQIEPLRRAVEHEIAEAADTSVHVIRMDMQLAAMGSAAAIEFPVPVPTQENPPAIERPVPRATTTDSEEEPEPIARLSIEFPQATASPNVALNSSRTDCIDTLRCRAFGLAESLAQRFGIGDLVLPLPDTGLGFLVKDVPTGDVVEQIDDELRASVSTMWWQLLAFSETMNAPDAIVDAHFDEDSELHSILRDGRIQLLFERIWIIDPSHFADKFWSQLSDQDWQDWLLLAQTYRELHQLSLREERPLWEAVA